MYQIWSGWSPAQLEAGAEAYPRRVALTLIAFAVLFAPVVMAVTALIWGGGSLLIDVWHCHHPRRDLLEHLDRFHPFSPLADEAERWLQAQN